MTEPSAHAPLPKPPQSSGFRRLVVMLAVVAATAAAIVVVRDASRPPGSPRDMAPPPARDDAPEDSLARALRLAGVDDMKKNAWVEEIPGVDLSALDATRMDVFWRSANARRCTCGCGFTLAACRVYDPSCEVSGPLVAALLDSVSRGLVSGARGLRERPEPGAGPRASQ